MADLGRAVGLPHRRRGATCSEARPDARRWLVPQHICVHRTRNAAEQDQLLFSITIGHCDSRVPEDEAFCNGDVVQLGPVITAAICQTTPLEIKLW